MEKRGWLLSLALGAVILGLAGFALIADTFAREPDFTVLRSQVSVPIKLANKKKSTRMVGPKAPGWVALSQISNSVMGAVVSSEDTSFFSHQGVDYHELREALKKDLQEKRWARGASTITQQVVKNVFLSQEKTLWRKFKEFFWAQKLDKKLSKSEVLAFYLNMAEWGPGIYGIGQAAEHYFNVPASRLSAKQAAFLAMLLPSPVKYHTYFGNKKLTPWAQSRIEKILKVMSKMGFIDEEAYQAALAENLWEVADPAGTASDWAEGEGIEDGAAPTAAPNLNHDKSIEPELKPEVESQAQPKPQPTPQNDGDDDQEGPIPDEVFEETP